MGPELHYQLIINRVAELHEEATSHRRAREAQASRKAHERSSSRRMRAGLSKFRIS
ncbi:hypothetical protein Aph01nite_74890 [Acrocarpospora phusangensis]|uniref:Uncharacterized protein n=1 Tax=Acrocarpospora phusangensis TaxID=1070424 RepID=A0A919UPU7_9ACTN|nr:hypothetical protein [Acrocarpospora phusangensis]GIH29179.1 hypothetical protein Aph01nite_74890 [Acrocarpospora phusangensis]